MSYLRHSFCPAPGDGGASIEGRQQDRPATYCTHARIGARGRGEHLEAIAEMFSRAPDASDTEKTGAREGFERRNRGIVNQLRARDRHP